MNKLRATPSLSSLGDLNIWRDVTFMCLYRPDYHRKVARFLSKLRRGWGLCFKMDAGNRNQREIEYARNSFIDTKLPGELKWSIRCAVQKEFGFDLFGPEFDMSMPLRLRYYRNSPY
jgi:hypothetical protein